MVIESVQTNKLQNLIIVILRSDTFRLILYNIPGASKVSSCLSFKNKVKIYCKGALYIIAL